MFALRITIIPKKESPTGDKGAVLRPDTVLHATFLNDSRKNADPLSRS